MLKINEPDGSSLQPKRPPRPRRRTTAVMSVSVEDPPPDVAHARGIVLVPVGRDSRAVALRVYEAHLGTEVFPLLVTPGSPLVGDIPAINAESFVAFPNGAFPGRAQMSAAFQHVRDVPAGRLLVVVEFADLIDAYRFNDIVKTVRKAAGPFSSRTRMIVLFDERNPVADQFYEAGCFVRDWFLSRTLLVVPAGDPAAAVDVGAGVGAEDEALAELRRRVLGDPAACGRATRGSPACSQQSTGGASTCRPGALAGGAGCRDGPGPGAAVNAIAAAFAGEAVETLRLGYRLGTESGRERVVYGDLPFSPRCCASRPSFSRRFWRQHSRDAGRDAREKAKAARAAARHPPVVGGQGRPRRDYRRRHGRFGDGGALHGARGRRKGRRRGQLAVCAGSRPALPAARLARSRCGCPCSTGARRTPGCGPWGCRRGRRASSSAARRPWATSSALTCSSRACRRGCPPARSRWRPRVFRGPARGGGRHGGRRGAGSDDGAREARRARPLLPQLCGLAAWPAPPRPRRGRSRHRHGRHPEAHHAGARDGSWGVLVF